MTVSLTKRGRALLRSVRTLHARLAITSRAGRHTRRYVRTVTFHAPKATRHAATR